MRPLEIHVFLHGGDTERLTEIGLNLKKLLKGQELIMASLQERFDAVNAKQDDTIAKLNEASTEILAELTKLRAGGDLTPEQEQSLANIEAKAQALADTATALAETSPPV